MRHLAGFFPAEEYPDILVGLGEPDDAAVIRIDESRALIKTLDFFTPIVDDPWTYGAIAATNAMSDVYAMGGDVIACLNIAGFPNDFDNESIVQIFAGGAMKVREANAALTGGHTVVNPETFYGMSVTGWVDPTRIMTKSGAQPGDRLILTKALGTGIITTAAMVTGPAESVEDREERRKQGKPDLDVKDLDAAIISMLTLNRNASLAARTAGVRCATDVTGFGLLGHGCEMAIASGKLSGTGLRIRAADVPSLPGVRKYIEAEYLTRGSRLNPLEFGEHVRFEDSVPLHLRIMMWEAETSGGLLMAVPEASMSEFVRTAAESKLTYWIIGEAIERAGIEVV